jgi:NAD(P)-dependent dehydrogenase (short-subunit alcohol dehydrogenase family)
MSGYHPFSVQGEQTMKLTGKKALITGGNSGIGLATAKLFVEEGAEVAITGRDENTLTQAVQLLGPREIACRADVSNSDDRRTLFENLAKQFGKLDIVFANAGVSGQTVLGSTDEEEFDNIIRVNLKGVFFTVNGAVPLLNDGGSVILNGSVIGTLGQPGYSAYAATKAAVRALARTFAADLAGRNIRVNVVAPGATKTPIWGKNGLSADVDGLYARLAKTIPLGRLGEPEEIAKAVLFLASNDSSYINAVELFADGGATGTPFGGPAFRV